jgi:hypothetical protein
VKLNRWKQAATGLAAIVAGGGGVLIGAHLGGAAPRPAAGATRRNPSPGRNRAAPLFITPGWTGIKPSSIVLSADGGNVPYNLKWSQWNDQGAVGKGVVGIESCNPNCAQGTTTPMPVRITFSDVRHGHYSYITESIRGMPNPTKGTGQITAGWPFGASSKRAPANGNTALPGTTVTEYLTTRAAAERGAIRL